MIHRIYQLSCSLIKMASLLFFLSNCKDTSKIGVGSPTKFSIDTMVQPFVANKDTRALSVAILKDGKAQYYDYGFISTDISKAPTRKSIYEIGSISKTFTTTVLAQMVQEKKIELNDPVDLYFPSGLSDWPDDRPVTFLDLATHHSGLPRIPDNLTPSYLKNPANPYANYFEADLEAFVNDYSPIDEGKRKVSYSNLGMGLLGYLLVRIDHQADYESLVKGRIFDPLQMTASYLNVDGNDLLPGHDDKGNVVSSWEFPVLAGAGGIRSNTEDMLRYLKAQADGKFAPDILFTPQYEYDDKRQIGLGWLIENDHQITWHNGGTGGFRSFIGFSREEKVAVVVLTNSTHSVDDIGFAIISGLLRD